MKIDNQQFLFFNSCLHVLKLRIHDKVIAFLYYRTKTTNENQNIGFTPQQIKKDFADAGLGKQDVTRIKKALLGDKRAIKTAPNKWRIRGDKVTELENQLKLGQCLKEKGDAQTAKVGGAYVHRARIQALGNIKSKFDFSRLVQMLTELNYVFSMENYISVILLTRAILDHIPPVFGFKVFVEVANNYTGSKSFKASMLNLENSSRNIANGYLHIPVRKSESSPNKNQVDFSNDLDCLLAEIIRISH